MTTLLGTGVRRFDSCFFRQGPETTEMVASGEWCQCAFIPGFILKPANVVSPYRFEFDESWVSGIENDLGSVSSMDAICASARSYWLRKCQIAGSSTLEH